MDMPAPMAARGRRATAVAVVLPLLAFVLAACATPKNLAEIEKDPSAAFAGFSDSRLQRLFQDDLDAGPGESGFVLLPRGDLGFQSRYNLAVAAEHSIDVQYYIWHPDTTGRLLTHRLLEAAERGVRVRILIDDLQVAGRDHTIAMVDTHPNIEVRLFNPVTLRQNVVSELITDATRLNRRMHNKTFIADNAMAVVGGRNIGDDYFGVNTHANFRDLDLLAVGPVVQDVSASFDIYWNSIWAVPIASLAVRQPTAEEIEAATAEALGWRAEQSDFPYPLEGTAAEVVENLQASRPDFVWGRAEALYDAPDKVASSGDGAITERLREVGDGIEHEILIEMAYFIPGTAGIADLEARKDENIRVRVLTNSLASNDVIAAHAGYARYRVPLLQNGVELYEMRADAALKRDKDGAYGLTGSAGAALHTKAAVIDRHKVFIGSYNFDPRSRALNTEIGLLVHSPELAEQVAAFMDTGVTPAESYRIELSGGGGSPVVWVTSEDGAAKRYDAEPEASFWQQMQLWLMSLLPIESQL